MKRNTIFIIMIAILIILPNIVFATGSIQLSSRNLSITKGKTGTFNISASNACGQIEVYSSNPAVATVNVSNIWIENETVAVTVTGISAGTASITVKLSDVATFDEEELTGSYTVNVTVSEPQNNNVSNNVNNNVQNNLSKDNEGETVNNIAQNNLSKNNKIGNLSIEDYELIKKDENTYELTVSHNITNITINAIPEDSKASITGTGIKNIEVGVNTFEVIVTSESGEKNKYTINVTRKDGYYLEDLNNIIDKVENNPLDVIITKDSKITQEDLNKIKESPKAVRFNYYEEDKVIYSWIINGSQLGNTDEINTNINFLPEYVDEIGSLSNYADGIYMNFENAGQVPNGTKIKIYVGDKFKDESLVNVYCYNKDNNSLDNIKNDIIVTEGYIEFEVKSYSNYFITRATITQEYTETSENNIFMIISIIILVIIVGLIIILCLKIKQIKKL